MLSKLAGVAAAIGAWELGWFLYQRRERKVLFDKAETAARKHAKPLLIVGNPYGQYGCGVVGDVVLDVRSSSECPTQVVGSVEAIPYADKYFGAAICSHVLEHTCLPDKGLAELYRVADEVFIASPYPWRLSTYLVPRHAWYVTGKPPTLQFHKLYNACNLIGRVGERLGTSGQPYAPTSASGPRTHVPRRSS